MTTSLTHAPRPAAALDVAEAEACIRRNMPSFGAQSVPIGEAMGRILRAPVAAERDQPPYDRVMMDGIALHFAALGDRHPLPILGAQRAGMDALTLADPAACLEAMTGAMLPRGTDTVIPVERITRGGGIATVEPGYVGEPGQFIHRQGSDCRKGDVLLHAGVRLNAAAIAVLAGNGCARVDVAQQPRIAIVSTGDELVPPESAVEPWQIRRSNERAIAASLEGHGLGRATCLWTPDDLDTTMATLQTALAGRDVVILTGGVSMGDYDYVPQALERLGVRKIFHKIAQRPGRPLWFGVGPQGEVVFALPGSPVSAVTCCARYVIPALLAAQGASARPYRPVPLAQATERLAGMTRFVPARLIAQDDGRTVAAPFAVPTSGDFSHLGMTDGIVEISPGKGVAEAGDIVNFHVW